MKKFIIALATWSLMIAGFTITVVPHPVILASSSVSVHIIAPVPSYGVIDPPPA